MKCDWGAWSFSSFHCNQEATHIVEHPLLGAVPMCDEHRREWNRYPARAIGEVEG